MIFKKIKNKKKVFAYIYQEIYLVKELKVNLLIRTNILGFGKVVINLGLKKVYLKSYKVFIPIEVKN